MIVEEGYEQRIDVLLFVTSTPKKKKIARVSLVFYT
jgi:hypothetical protein